MKAIRAVCFDVDGVLLDSLGAHLNVCEDKARKYGLNLRVPCPAEFKDMMRHGVKASPMNLMFEAAGFTPEDAEKAFAEYKATFAEEYQIPPFPGIEPMLSALRDTGLRLGIVTANVKANVESALGRTMKFFDPKCVFTKDGPHGSSKAESLREAIRVFGMGPDECLYVGDQPADWHAAHEAGVRFLGVTYGWGISKANQEFPTVDDVPGITDFVLQLNNVVVAR